MSNFLYIPGITGESKDANHPGWIDIDTFYTGTQRLITSHTSTRGDRESANAMTRDLILTKRMDKASPALLIDSCCMRAKEMILHLTKTGAGGGADVYMEYILRHAIISNYTVHGLSQSPTRPHEKFIISYTDIEAKYTPYDEDGNAEANIAVGFDTATNTKK
ncbi:MAG: type VI secretion system tube protein Hcp [Cellvibrionaceae bacterium]|nr:type VI secretion system tube protein Hcp [Cellvibrionaceae bacterium]